MEDYAEHQPLADIFGINPEDYSGVSVFTLPFSIRVLNRFRQKNINTVRDLLLVDIAYLMSINGFGTQSLSQIIAYCKEIAGTKETDMAKSPLWKNDTLFSFYLDEIAIGNFSFANSLVLTFWQKQQLSKLNDSYDLLGGEMVKQCIHTPEKVKPIIAGLTDFYIRNDNQKRFSTIVNKIPAFRKKNSAKYYIDAFSFDENTRERIAKYYGSTDDELCSILENKKAESEIDIFFVEKFLQWCTYDLADEIKQFFERLYSTPRNQTVIEGRAGKLTLNEIGEQLGVSRERVRQIEAKAIRQFINAQARMKIIPKIYADQNGQAVITYEDLEAYSGSNTNALVYLLKSVNVSASYSYDYQLDAFVFGDNDLPTRLHDYIDSLPDVLQKSGIASVIKVACEEYGLEEEYVEKALNDDYKVTGDIYHRARLSLAQIYDTVLRKYYANGIHIYDDEMIAELRQHIINDYGDIDLPANNRAIASRIASICVLAGRGIYAPKKKKWISDELAQSILTHILESKAPILFIGSIFSTFEEELEREGIDNRYYLQGILHELFGDKLYFRRDYVSKDKGYTSFYSSIIAYIKRAKYPVNKDELRAQFPGITDIVITMATSDSDILNYFGEYLHGSNLNIRESEKAFLAEYLKKTLQDGEAHHIKDIYDEIISGKPELFSRNAVTGSYSAYSILEYLFREQYQFSRPYIAQYNVEIGRPTERLHEMLYSMERFYISDITTFAKENHMQIQSLLEYINTLNDKYLFRDQDTLATCEEIGVDSNIANNVESMICEEITHTTAIRELKCFNAFPNIRVPWNEWLLYSVLKKWSKRLDVAMSNAQIRQAIPLVSLIGEMDTERYKGISNKPVRYGVIDLDDIDSLFADILVSEMLGEDK